METPASPTTSTASTAKKPIPGRRFSTRRPRSNSYGAHGYHGHLDAHHDALAKIRTFLKTRSVFDVFPLSYRLVVIDTKLPVKHALNVMHQHGVISAPLYNSKKWKFEGMLTLLDLIHLIQFYYLKCETFETAAADVETFRIESLRVIEKELNVPPPPLHSIHPSRPLFEACKLLIQSHARRLPLIDHDPTSGMELIASVLTQYRVLKFIANNCKEVKNLNYSLRSVGIGTYVEPKADDPFYPIATATMDTTVFDVVHMFSQRGISAVPILDENGLVVNLFETVDVTTLIRSGTYTKLDLSVRSALSLRPADFQGAVTCTSTDSLGQLLEFIGLQKMHRLVVVEGEGPNRGRLAGMITLSDIIRYIVRDHTHSTNNLPSLCGHSSVSLQPTVESPVETESAQ